ncbi:helicase-related protein [Candidatus Poseidoniales archaeon]|nr:helicase-related protein [Candidatus Poseidoniales archaeon]
MQPPFLIKKEGRVALVEWKESALLGPGKFNGFFLDDPSLDVQWGLDEVKQLIRPTEGVNGQILRFILANRWLDFGGAKRMSIALRACVDFSSFQLRPLVKFFGEAERRLLIADETGLGKTIEAGMILAEVLAAQPDACIVILSPASVKWKWKKELRDKFGIRANYGNLKKFKEFSVPKGVHIITHSASREQTEINIPNGCIELLIIDEIHNFIGRSESQKRRMRAMDLSKASNSMVGLSATPIQIEANDLRRILNLISPGEFPEESWNKFCRIQIAVNNVMTSMRESNAADSEDVDVLKEHWDNSIPIEPGDLVNGIDNQSWHDVELRVKTIGPIGRKMTRARARDPDVIGPEGKSLSRERRVHDHIVPPGKYHNLITEIDEYISGNLSFVHRRQFASCPAAVFNLFSGLDNNLINPSSILSQAELIMANQGPKQRILMHLLSEMESRDDVQRVVVFTHWHPTFFYLEPILRNKFNLFSVNPNMDDDFIPSVVNAFRECDDFAILLVTDKMSEGVDLEMANVMFNMDLPYNPARLQQRIGRLDRYIQESDFIEIHNLVLEGSLEEKQLEILEKRLQVFKSVIGGYEAIIATDWDEGDIQEFEREIVSTRDLLRLSEQNTVLRVVDSGFDGLIAEMRGRINPINSNMYRIIENTFTLLHGSEFTYNDNMLSFKLPERLRSRLLNSKSFFDSEGRGRFIFENLDDNGHLVIETAGKSSTFGPLDKFLVACENILLYSEDLLRKGNTRKKSNKIIGQRTVENRWIISAGDTIKQIGTSEIITRISNGAIEMGDWLISDSNTIEALLE